MKHPFHSNPNNYSLIHQKVSTYLEEININHINEPRNKFIGYCDKLEKEYSPIPDILLLDVNGIIEIYGDYFHCNPKYYKENDIF